MECIVTSWRKIITRGRKGIPPQMFQNLIRDAGKLNQQIPMSDGKFDYFFLKK